MTRIRRSTALALAAVLTTAALATAADMDAQTPGRVSNDPGAAAGVEHLLMENVTLTRSDDRIGIEVKLLTPEAGGYTYPETIPAERQAQPEVFTGWAFVFNHPENCVSFPDSAFPCGPEDFNDQAKGGVYNFGGFTNSVSQSGGGALVLNEATEGYVVLHGDIMVGQEQRPDLPPEAATFPLENPAGAEVHVAIAPHGQVDAETLAEELYDPTGSPVCGCWWVATFEQPASS